MTGEMTCSRDEFLRSEYYNDFLSRIGIFHGLGAVLAPEAGAVGFLASFRPPSGSEFEPEVLQTVRRVLPHVQRALQIHKRIEQADMRGRFALEALGLLGAALVVVDPHSRVLLINEYADKLLARVSVVGVRDGRLCAARTPDSARIWSAVKAASGKPSDGGDSGSVVRLRDRTAGTVALLVCRLAKQHAGLFWHEQSAVAVFMTTPDLQPRADAGILKSAYGLTKTEAAILLGLLSGSSLTETADQNGISRSTARWHMRHIVTKLGVSRQSQAVALAARELLGITQRSMETT